MINKMKKSFTIVFIFLLIGGNGRAQSTETVQSKLITVKTSQWEKPDSYPLLDEKAIQVGTYSVKILPDHNFRYVVEYNGQTIEVDALTSIGIIPEANRIVTWGSGLEVHFEYTMSYKIYDLSGTLIKSGIQVNSAPYRATITAEGGLVYAARTTADLNDTTLYLHKIDRNGEVLWVRDLGIRYPQEIAVSGFNGDIALMEKDWVNSNSEIRIYDDQGTHLTTLDREVVSAIEFVDENQIAVSGSKSWYVYDYSEGTVQSIVKGSIHGNVMSMHPFIKLNDDLIAVAHLWSEKLLAGYQVDIYNLGNGALVHTIFVSRNTYSRRTYRCLIYENESGVLTVRAGKQEITYLLTITK